MQVLVIYFQPPPQDFEQSVHSVHSVQPPLTAPSLEMTNNSGLQYHTTIAILRMCHNKNKQMCHIINRDACGIVYTCRTLPWRLTKKPQESPEFRIQSYVLAWLFNDVATLDNLKCLSLHFVFLTFIVSCGTVIHIFQG